VAVGLGGGCLHAVAPTAGPAGDCPATVGQEVLDRVNEIRSARGLTPVRPHPELIRAARLHSDDQATRNEVTHDGSDGSRASDRISLAGYDWSMTGENVGGGLDTAAGVVEAWMNSPSHRSIILAPGLVDAGVGVTESSEPGLRWFWTLDLAHPAEGEETGAIPCHP
jgi:uncharacterized protein YkwD